MNGRNWILFQHYTNLTIKKNAGLKIPNIGQRLFPFWHIWFSDILFYYDIVFEIVTQMFHDYLYSKIQTKLQKIQFSWVKHVSIDKIVFMKIITKYSKYRFSVSWREASEVAMAVRVRPSSDCYSLFLLTLNLYVPSVYIWQQQLFSLPIPRTTSKK